VLAAHPANPLDAGRSLLDRIEGDPRSGVVLFVKAALYLRISTSEQTTANQLPDLDALHSDSRGLRNAGRLAFVFLWRPLLVILL
jgi:hypothetical protein